MLTLYQFPISHYCAKVRWALDYKGLPYTQFNLLPGSHVKAVKMRFTGITDKAPLTGSPVLSVWYPVES